MSAETLKAVTALAVPIATILAALVTAIGLWMVARPKGKVDLIQVAQTAAREVIASLQAEVDRLDGDVKELRGDVKSLREERHALANRVMAEKRRADLAESAVRALQQLVESLQRRMRAAGLPIDAPGGYRDQGVVVLSGEVMSPPPPPDESEPIP